MEIIDRQLQQRVWQRVRGTDPLPEDAGQLLELIAGEWVDGIAYLRLANRYRGSEAALLRRMHQQEQAHIACLKGVYRMLTGRQPTVKAPPLPRESRETALRRCYHRELRCMEQYRRWEEHPQFGAVFGRLLEQEQLHCQQLLGLIGRLGER